MFNKIEIYSKDSCSSCNSLISLVNTQYNDLFEEVSILKLGDDITVEQLTEILGFRPRAVPQVIIDGQYIGSFRQTVTYLNNHKQKEESN